MCRECDENDYDDDFDDYEDEETSMEDRWYEFYSWLDGLSGYELADYVNAPRGGSAESDETESFMMHLVSSWKSDFETNIDEDGVNDCKRRMSVRDEDRINSQSAVDSMTGHDIVLCAVDLGLYQRNPIDEGTARLNLVTVGVALHDVLWNKAAQCETNGYGVAQL